MNVVWFSCFPSHSQNERKVRDMTSHDIINQTVILDNYVEGSLPKGLANHMGLAVLARLVAPRPNLGGYSKCPQIRNGHIRNCRLLSERIFSSL